MGGLSHGCKSIRTNIKFNYLPPLNTCNYPWATHVGKGRCDGVGSPGAASPVTTFPYIYYFQNVMYYIAWSAIVWLATYL